MPHPAWRRIAAARAFAVLLLAACAAALHASPLPAEVQRALERAKVPREAVAIVVEEVGARRSRLAWQDERAMHPASLMKIPTTLAALDLLGPAWTWTTPVWLDGRVDAAAGTLDGNLVIRGSGDPKLVLERLWLLLRRVQQLGVREIRGDIVLDRSAFDVAAADPGEFDGEPLRAYNVQPDALLVNFKSLVYGFVPDAARGVAVVTVDPPLAGAAVPAPVPLAAGPCNDWRGALRADFSDALRPRFAGSYPAACGERQWPLAAADPRAFAALAISGLWRELGGRLAGSVRDGAAPNTQPTFELSSPALADVVRDINKFSNNVMARQLFLTLARTRPATVDAAQAAVGEWLAARIGREPAAAFVLDNGAGLSRSARTSARALAKLLQAAWLAPTMPEFVASLPVTGVDGTLRRAAGAAPGRAHLKSGSLRDVAALAGYVHGASGARHVVVAIVNHPNANDARPALEALVAWAANDLPARQPAAHEPRP